MRVFQPEDFEKMARAVVDGYLKKATPLESNIVKVALDNGLSPDQIRNLVQLANTMAHLTLFNEKKDGDKVVEFEPADPLAVLKRIYHDKTPAPALSEQSDASAPMSSVQDLFGDLSEIADKVKALAVAPGDDEAPAAVETPEAAESVPDQSQVSVSPAKRQMLIIKIRKVAEDLNDRRLQHACEYKEELDKLAAEFAKLYGPNYAEFEKDAVSVRGRTALPVLADIRRCLRMPEMREVSFEKQARVVDTDNDHMHSLDRLIKLAQDFEHTDNACLYVQREFGKCL